MLVFNYPGQLYTLFDPDITYDNIAIAKVLDSILYDLDSAK